MELKSLIAVASLLIINGVHSYNTKICVSNMDGWLNSLNGEYQAEGVDNNRPNYNQIQCTSPPCVVKLHLDSSNKWIFANINTGQTGAFCNDGQSHQNPESCTNWWGLSNPTANYVAVCPDSETVPESAATTTTSTTSPITTTSSAVNAPIIITAENKNYLVDQHNLVRSDVALGKAIGQNGNALPKAAKMYVTAWDDTIAATAQNWANQCQQIHDPNGQYAENIIWGYNNIDPLKDAVGYPDLKGWASELKNYNYGLQGTPFGVVGHFTTVIYQSHTKFGCGFAHCPQNPKRWTPVPDGPTYVLPYWFVCRYGGTEGKAGPEPANVPYTESTTTGSGCNSLNSQNGLCFD